MLHGPDEVQDRGEDLGKPSPEVGEDLAEVVPTAAEDGEDRVAEGALETAPRQPAVSLRVTDLRLDAAAASERLCQGGVRPRRAPLIRTCVSSTPCPL